MSLICCSYMKHLWFYKILVKECSSLSGLYKRIFLKGKQKGGTHATMSVKVKIIEIIGCHESARKHV